MNALIGETVRMGTGIFLLLICVLFPQVDAIICDENFYFKILIYYLHINDRKIKVYWILCDSYLYIGKCVDTRIE